MLSKISHQGGGFGQKAVDDGTRGIWCHAIAGLALALTTLLGAGVAHATELGMGGFEIAGTRLLLAPESQVDLASLLPRDPAHFVVPGKVSNGGLIPAEASIAQGLLRQPGVENPADAQGRFRFDSVRQTDCGGWARPSSSTW